MIKDPPSVAIQKTLALFDAPTEDQRDVMWLLEFLKGRDWTTAEEILKRLGKEPTEDAKRWVRRLADSSNGQIVGFHKGYKLTKAMTPEQYQHWRNTTLKATRSVKDRVLRTDEVFGFTGKDD